MRPELEGRADIVYDAAGAEKYTRSSRMLDLQASMTLRALELLDVDPDTCFMLDIGCGSGLSGEILTEEGFNWAGIDISPHMLQVALQREVEGDVLLGDIGHGLPFRAGVFDAAISISVLQWLLVSDSKVLRPHQRLSNFFKSLYSSLASNGKACLQFYPPNPEALELVLQSARKAGFNGGVIVDEPESRRKTKHYLMLQSGQSPMPINTTNSRFDHDSLVELNKAGVGNNFGHSSDPSILNSNSTAISNANDPLNQAHRGQRNKNSSNPNRKQWILKKKESQTRRGKVVKRDSKYTGRSRGPKF